MSSTAQPKAVPEFKAPGELIDPRRLALTEDLKREVERFHPGIYLSPKMLRYYSTFILFPDHVLSEVPELDGALVSLLRNLGLANPDEWDSGRMLKDLHGKTLRITDALLICLVKLQSVETKFARNKKFGEVCHGVDCKLLAAHYFIIVARQLLKYYNLLAVHPT